jgi:hypothetical protein
MAPLYFNATYFYKVYLLKALLQASMHTSVSLNGSRNFLSKLAGRKNFRGVKMWIGIPLRTDV